MKIVVLSPKSFCCFKKKCIDFEWYTEDPAHYTMVYHIFIHENSRNLIAVLYQSGSKKLVKDNKLAMEETPVCILHPHKI